MTCQCLSCSAINLRAYPKHANEGMAPCRLLSKVGEFKTLTYARECDKFSRARDDVIVKRQAWHDQITMFRRVKSETAAI